MWFKKKQKEPLVINFKFDKKTRVVSLFSSDVDMEIINRFRKLFDTADVNGKTILQLLTDYDFDIETLEVIAHRNK